VQFSKPITVQRQFYKTKPIQRVRQTLNVPSAAIIGGRPSASGLATINISSQSDIAQLCNENFN